MKDVTNKDLLNSTGSYILYLMMTYKGELSENMYVCTQTVSLCCTPEADTVL